MKPYARNILIACVALVTCAITIVIIGYLEYRTNVVAQALGSYLVDINVSRASTGRLWDQISSEQVARTAIPDSTIRLDTPPSDLPPLVRRNSLSLERIPETGIPGFLAIQVDPVPDRNDIVETHRLIYGSRLARLGRDILERAEFDATAFLNEANSRATEMAAGLESEESSTELDTTVATDSTLVSHDAIRASVTETFVGVILEEHAARLKQEALADWYAGHIHQLFLNRALGDHIGELYYADPERSHSRFRLPNATASELFDVVSESADRATTKEAISSQE